MFRIRVFSAAVLPALLLAGGCSSLSPTDNGVLAGGAAGAGAGAIAGHALHNTGAGAAIGLVGGAIAGGLVGNKIEKKEAKEAVAAAEAQAQAGMAEIIQMSQNHVGDSVIITKVRTSPVIYNLSSQDVLTLKQNGVSDAVVNEMMATTTRYPRRVYSAAPVYPQPVYQPAVYVVEPPPPPVAVGVGIGFGGGRSCH
jgi:outer membrane protein with glycine zipper